MVPLDDFGLPGRTCVRLRPQYAGPVWSREFVQDRPLNGRTLRMLTIIDELTRECLSIDVDRRLSSDRVLERLTELFAQRGAPDYQRSLASARATVPSSRRRRCARGSAS